MAALSKTGKYKHLNIFITLIFSGGGRGMGPSGYGCIYMYIRHRSVSTSSRLTYFCQMGLFILAFYNQVLSAIKLEVLKRSPESDVESQDLLGSV